MGTPSLDSVLKYRSRPEFQAEQKAYRDRPEGKARQQAWNYEHRLLKYGVTREEYTRLFDLQNGVCGLCRFPETASYKGKTRLLAVDHDHTTGQVRGLLCTRCNVTLGFFEALQDETLLAQIKTYLEKNP